MVLKKEGNSALYDIDISIFKIDCVMQNYVAFPHRYSISTISHVTSSQSDYSYSDSDMSKSHNSLQKSLQKNLRHYHRRIEALRQSPFLLVRRSNCSCTFARFVFDRTLFDSVFPCFSCSNSTFIRGKFDLFAFWVFISFFNYVLLWPLQIIILQSLD